VRLFRPEMWVWLLAIPVVAAAWGIHYRYKWRHRAREAAGPGSTTLSRRTRSRRDIATLLMSLVMVTTLGAAMMRPQLRSEERIPTFERRDLILILDQSISMRARDIAPSRFARATEEIQHFLHARPETFDRVGLIGFAERSIVLSYPTDDMDSLSFYLDWARDDRTPLFGTNISEALISALTASRRERQRLPPTFVVISDGDDQSGELARAVAAVRREGIVVHAIGIGTDQRVPMPVPRDDGRDEWLRDDNGDVLRTRFGENTLRQVAMMTGGTYFRSRTGGELLSALESITVEARRQTGWTTRIEYRELYPILLSIGAIGGCFLLALL
jgi:Ca-activated chloride channel homolog